MNRLTYEGLSFEPFTEKDIDVFSPIMKRAFDEDARRHTENSSGGPDGYDNGDFLRRWYLHKDVTAFKIYQGSKPVGAIALWINENNVNYLGNVFIDTDFQDQGMGLTIWKFIEQAYSQTKIWRTETPGFSKRNHHFYVNKCGFKVVKIKNPKDKYGEYYILEKEIQ